MTDLDLSNRARHTVLVTRPHGQHEPLITALQQAGWPCEHLPLMSIEAIEDNPLIKSTIMDLDQFQHVICVSANAARLATDWIDQYWPQMPFGMHWYAVGEASARPFNALDIFPQVPHQALTEGLLALDGLQTITGDKVLILRGEGGRETLAESLTARGAEVQYLELYRRLLCPISPTDLQQLIEQHTVHYVVLTSGELVQHFINSCSAHTESFAANALKNLHFIVPSERVATLARSQGVQTVSVSQGAHHDAILECLHRIK